MKNIRINRSGKIKWDYFFDLWMLDGTATPTDNNVMIILAIILE
jgi:hypothetical protein